MITACLLWAKKERRPHGKIRMDAKFIIIFLLKVFTLDNICVIIRV
nr:MAG TPA: hypothetical protein [Caudoviricetes sp.]